MVGHAGLGTSKVDDGLAPPLPRSAAASALGAHGGHPGWAGTVAITKPPGSWCSAGGAVRGGAQSL